MAFLERRALTGVSGLNAIQGSTTFSDWSLAVKCLTTGFWAIENVGCGEQKLFLKVVCLVELNFNVKQDGFFSSQWCHKDSISALCNAQITEGGMCFISFHAVFSFSNVLRGKGPRRQLCFIFLLLRSIKSLSGISALMPCDFTSFYLPSLSCSFSPLIFVIWLCDLFICMLVFLLREDLLNHWGGGKGCTCSWWATIKPWSHSAIRVCRWQPFSWRVWVTFPSGLRLLGTWELRKWGWGANANDLFLGCKMNYRFW